MLRTLGSFGHALFTHNHVTQYCDVYMKKKHLSTGISYMWFLEGHRIRVKFGSDFFFQPFDVFCVVNNVSLCKNYTGSLSSIIARHSIQ